MAACNSSLPSGHIELPGFLRDLAVLEAELHANGLFEPSAIRFASEYLFIACLVLASILVSRRRPLVGGFAMGLAILSHFRQAHESGHEKGFWHQDYWPSTQLRSGVYHLITNLGAGVDGDVWRMEHRLHHAYTLSKRDPQIVIEDLMPLCTRNETVLASYMAHYPVRSVLARWQEVTFLPMLMLVGRYFLSYITWIKMAKASSEHLLMRKLLLVGHYVLQAAFMWFRLWRGRPLETRRRRLCDCALWFGACTLTAGIIEPLFLFNHIHTGPSNTLDANDKIAQVCHTINYAMRLSSWLPLDEYLMPIAYHIEHHLVPKMPDENLPRIQADVVRITAKHGLPYRTEPFEMLAWDWNIQLMRVPRDRLDGAGVLMMFPSIALLSWLILVPRQRRCLEQSRACCDGMWRLIAKHVLSHPGRQLRGAGCNGENTGKPMM